MFVWGTSKSLFVATKLHHSSLQWSFLVCNCILTPPVFMLLFAAERRWLTFKMCLPVVLTLLLLLVWTHQDTFKLNVWYIKHFVALTNLPRVCAERVSLSVYTSPHTDISRHTPGLDSSVKPPRGCITSTPLVVSPSIWPSGFFHLAAFSCGQMNMVNDLTCTHTHPWVPWLILFTFIFTKLFWKFPLDQQKKILCKPEHLCIYRQRLSQIPVIKVARGIFHWQYIYVSVWSCGSTHSPLGRCSWKSQSLQHRCVQCMEGCVHTPPDRQSARWCSVWWESPRHLYPQTQCPLPQSQWGSLSIAQSKFTTQKKCVCLNAWSMVGRTQI